MPTKTLIVKNCYFLLCSLLFVLNFDAIGQNFVNGSFEIATDSCKLDIPHTGVQDIIPGVFSFGTSQGLDFRANSCPYLPSLQPTSARHGSKYLSFGFDGTGGDSFALALTLPLSAGQTYRLNFSQRRERGTAPPAPGYGRSSPFHDIGYSDDSSKFGHLIIHGHCVKGYYDSVFVWEDTMFEFTPTVNARFITFKSTANGEILYLDNFSITKPASVSGIAVKEVKCYPNPFNYYTAIQTGKIMSPFDVQVSDLNGRILYSRKNISQKDFRIYKDGLPIGVYVLQLSDRDKNRYYCKIAVL